MLRRSPVVLLLAGMLCACDPAAPGPLGDGGGVDGGADAARPPSGPISVTIDQPATGDTLLPATDTIFAGRAIDLRTNTVLPSEGLQWSSSVTGNLGPGYVLRLQLAEGAHTISLLATAADGKSGLAKIDVTVAAPALEVRVEQPTPRQLIDSQASINFRCRVRQGGADVATAEVTWTDQNDSLIGRGASIQTQLPDGVYDVTCAAREPTSGATGKAAVHFSVGKPALRIERPDHGSVQALGAAVTFRATVRSDDVAPYPVAWASDRDGQLGYGENVSSALLTEGMHVITARYFDLQGRESKDTITIYYALPNQRPVVTITTPDADGQHFASGSTVHFEGSAMDFEDGDISAAGTWYDYTRGSLGTGASANLESAVPGKYVTTYTCVDSDTARNTATRVLYVDPAGGEALVQNSGAGARITYLAVNSAGDLMLGNATQFVVGSTTYTPTQAGLASSATPVAVAEAGGTYAFAGSDGLGICSGSAAHLTCAAYGDAVAAALGTREVNDVAVLANRTVLAATANGLFVQPDGGGAWASYTGSHWGGSDRVRALTVAGTTAWLATAGGLVSFNTSTATGTAVANTGLADTDLLDVSEYRSVVWVAHAHGLSYSTISSGNRVWHNAGSSVGYPSQRSTQLAASGQQVVWGGTDGGGAYRYNTSTGWVVLHTTADGLISNSVLAVVVMPDGTKRFGTDNGLITWRGR